MKHEYVICARCNAQVPRYLFWDHWTEHDPDATRADLERQAAEAPVERIDDPYCRSCGQIDGTHAEWCGRDDEEP